ncbi:MAG: Hemolysin A [candidate division CPR2 bacterium GW2011_GWC1_39_9]|uniref:Hemolysin A n=1 Tax=candidate division CPR2 bacterium GW2011_GWC2_39_10 TaxID=1618345 RepID=A0A0G0PAN7_UNCC2|nr:MAG: Hemolysin A [candidate division CPR2 bacterium GW2011_GWC2_39_10]KKR33601.1 MAG: Hemolysin A [candidate division CPR2 bacterium GW2011_GWC1_39_9]
MKKRIDEILVEKELADSRERAKRLVMAGQVYIDEQQVQKPAEQVDVEANVWVKEAFPYVSRGALKLEKAFQEFNLDFQDKIVCDIGASTGGFTDFVLKNGAKKVYAIDVGYGQLAHKLRQDMRVINMERTHFLDVQNLPEKIDIFVCDVSFISLKKIIPHIKSIIQDQTQKADIICLVKPQFEVGKEIADRYKGVITDQKIRTDALNDIVTFTQSQGFEVLGQAESPIEGAKGNKEFLIYFK